MAPRRCHFRSLFSPTDIADHLPIVLPPVGVRLPVLARDQGGAILSFSDLFQPLPEEGQAKASKPVRNAVNAARRKMRSTTASTLKPGAALHKLCR